MNKIKLVPLWQDRKLDRNKQLQKILQKEVIDGDLNYPDSSWENLGNIRHVKGNLLLFLGRNLKELPEGLKVDKILILNYCHNLKELPKGLQVGGDLFLWGLNLTSLPADLKVGGKIWVSYDLPQIVNQAIEMFGQSKVVR